MKNRKILLSISTCIMIFSNSILAKETKKLEDITVTAQKSEENIQKVPMALSVLDEFAIEDADIRNTRDISKHIPNLTTMHAGSRDYFTRIAIRGISNTGIGDPAVALYIDDISYADIYAFDSPLFEIERIEVLKGPQGTLYGKNTEAGVINIITKKPSDELEGRINLEAGNYNYKQIMGSINIPLIEEKLFLKASALKSKRDGYLKNIYTNTNIDNHDTISLRANALYKINDKLESNLILAYNKLDDDGGFPMSPMDKTSYKTTTGLKKLNDFESAFNYKGKAEAKTKTSVLKFNYTNKNFDFVSITGYRNMDNKSTLDGDFTPSKNYVGFNERESKSLNQEFRLSSQVDSSFKWLVGTYFNKEDIDNATGYKLDENFATLYSMPIFTEDRMEADLSSKDFALFGQSTFRFFNNDLGVTTGLRYEKSKRAMDNRTHKMGSSNLVAPITGLEKKSSILLPKLTLDYQLNDKTMIYTSLSKGYKAGGYSLAVDNKALAEFEPEISKSVEVGLKSTMDDIGLTFNMTAFYTKVDDYQDRVQINPTTIVQANATKVDIKGFEIEGSYFINENFTLLGSLGLISAKYGEYIDPITKENYKNNKVSLIPKHDLNLGLKYRANNIFAKFEIQNTGEKYFDRSNSKKLDSYTVYNAKIGYEQEDWDIYLNVENITNEEYFLDGFNAGAIGYMGTVGSPRVFKVAFNYRF